LTGRAAPSLALQRWQLWSWAVGMMILSMPWHLLGMCGQWRRVAQFDYSDPNIAWWAPWMIASLIGGAIMVLSAGLFISNLAVFHMRSRTFSSASNTMQYAVPLHPGATLPAALNGFRLWNILVLILMAAAYVVPIAQSFIVKAPQAAVHRVNGK
jgi:cytochrome c oxidase subunit 1